MRQPLVHAALQLAFDSGDGATFGAVPEGAVLEFDDGRGVPLIDDRFFVVASDAEVHLSR
jgi:hypothetical protein